MRRIALALTAAFTGLLTTGAAEAKVAGPRVQEYKITRTSGQVKVTFHGDTAGDCAASGFCGISGTSTYAFGGIPEYGQIYWLKQRKRTVIFSGFAEIAGETRSDVGTAGSSERCVDRVHGERYEGLAFEPRSKRVRFQWRVFPKEGERNPQGFIGGPPSPDPFDTRCAGPALEDIESGAPFADIPYRVFRSPRSEFHATGTRPFAGGGFAGTVEWDLRYALQYRNRRG